MVGSRRDETRRWGEFCFGWKGEFVKSGYFSRSGQRMSERKMGKRRVVEIND